ncbi:MAG: PEP-CTERM-box response regulator transcription factor [Deltaproteobacteria bacterium]|nr:PEP-CTERM-box response regulator transcription factor [Deltaproteobacteria bacterium]
MKKKLLIIEDEAPLAKQLKWSLNSDYAVTIAGSARQARSLIESRTYPVITLDLGLPPFPDTPQEGFQLLGEIPSLSPHSKVIVITGNSERENAIKAIGLGAADFCSKPIDVKVLEIILSRAYRIHELEEANRTLERESSATGRLCGMLGVSEPMKRLFERIRQVSATDYPVLITGESGTGKEMVAHAIHSLSHRSSKPMVIINCVAIPEALLESELFGHEKGAFTGAVSRKIGRFEHAQEGTVFLDEIGDMPLTLQVKILRFLQEGTIERVGGCSTIRLDARVVAATNVDLEKAVREGTFREDLYHRLNVIPLSIPSLRERPEDIVVLAQHFLRQEGTGLLSEGRGLTFSRDAIAALAGHSWPGNVRELQNCIRRAVTLADAVVGPKHLGLGPPEDSLHPLEEPADLTLQAARDLAEIKAVRHALLRTGNNISQAARLLDISRPTLHDLLRKHAILVR